MNKVLLNIIILGLFSASLHAQDAHLSMYDGTPNALNPAMTGIGVDQYRWGTQFRSQWGSVARNPFLTTAVSFDMPIDDRWAVGGYVMNTDQAGIYNSLTFCATGSYRITDPAQAEHNLSVGINAGTIYKRTTRHDMIFERQYIGGGFNPNIDSGENIEQFNAILPEVGMGAFYSWEPEGETFHPYVGGSVYHITSPLENFLPGEDSRLPRRFVVHGGSVIHVDDKFRIDPRFFMQFQSNAREFNFGSRFMYDVDMKDEIFTIYAGGYYRLNDAVIAMIGAEYDRFLFRMSYDFNTSELRQFSDGRGGLEFSLIFMR